MLENKTWHLTWGGPYSTLKKEEKPSPEIKMNEGKFCLWVL